MNPQRELSTQVLKQNDKDVVKHKKNQQIVLRKQQKIKKLKELRLPNSFIDVLTKINKNKNYLLVINSFKNSDEYHTAKKLTKLYWLRAIKNKKGLVTFQETKMGKKIMKDVEPKIYKNTIDYCERGGNVAIAQALFGGFIGGLGIFLSPIIICIGMLIMFSSLITLAYYLHLDTIQTRNKKIKNRYLTPFNSIKSVKPLLKSTDAKCEFKLLMQYSK